MALILRIVKGSQLTHSELDDNFVYLDDRINGMTSAVDIAPYNGGTTYSGSVYVSYSGNVYLHISGTPTTGVIPSSDITKWQLVSAGVLIHEKNKDAFLDFGGANQVSASEIRTLIDNSQLIIIDTEALSLAIMGGTLIREASYLVYDNNPVCYVKAVTSNSLYPTASCIRYIPKHTSVGGTYDYWSDGGSYAIDDKVVFGNYVYKNLNGDNSGFPRITTSDWEIVDPTVVPSDYLMDFVSGKVQQRKDYGFNGVIEFKDGDGNEFEDIYYPCLNTSKNKFINSHWFDIDIHVQGTFKDNIFTNLHSVGASIQSIMGKYEGNIMNASLLSTNYGIFNGEFLRNICKNVNLSFQSVLNTATGFKFNRNVVEFANTVGIGLRADAVIEDCVINSKGSTAVDLLDGTTAVSGSTLDLNANSSNDAYGVYEITTADISIDSLTGFPTHFEKVILRPATGHFIDLITIDSGSVTGDALLVDVLAIGGTYTLNGDLGQYAIIEKSVNQGWNVFKVTLSL